MNDFFDNSTSDLSDPGTSASVTNFNAFNGEVQNEKISQQQNCKSNSEARYSDQEKKLEKISKSKKEMMNFLEERLIKTLPKNEIYGPEIKWANILVEEDSCSFIFTIQNYSLLNKNNGEYINSPIFSMNKNEDIKWFLKIYPAGETKNAEDYTSLFLYKAKDTLTSVKAKFFLAILGENNKNKELRDIKIFDTKVSSWGNSKFIKNEELFKPGFLLPGDTITIFCSISICNNMKSESKSIKLKRTMEESQANKKAKVDNHGSNIYEKCYMDDTFSDLTLIVENKEIKTHRVFLAAASPVFASILKEPKKINSITMTDISYEVVQEFLRFVYTKGVNNLRNIAHELIVAANKYGVQDLKFKCEESLCESITLDNALKIIAIADDCNANILKKRVAEFIIENKKILDLNPDFKEIFKSRPHLFELIVWPNL